MNSPLAYTAHVAGVPSSFGQHCKRCDALLSFGKKERFPAGALVGIGRYPDGRPFFHPYIIAGELDDDETPCWRPV